MSNARVIVPIAVIGLALAGVGIHRAVRGAPGVQLAESGRPEIAIPLPPFSLTDQDGKSVTLAELRGHVTIVDFIFTKCPSICPRLTQKMGTLVNETKADGEALRFVSISVDPDNDTPPVLRAYGEKAGADFRRWSFLTGDQKAVEDTVIRGFKMALEKDPSGSIAHAERFVLVDERGTIRAYFDADESAQRALLAAARKLVAAR